MSKHMFPIAALLAQLCLLAPLQAQSPVSDTEVAARELITTMKADDQFRAILPMLLKSLKPAIVQNRPDVERDFDALAPKLMAGMEARIGDFSDALVAVYATNFTADELRAVTAFYRTPVGQKLLQKTPLVAQQSLAAGQKIGRIVGADAERRMIEELRGRGHNL